MNDLEKKTQIAVIKSAGNEFERYYNEKLDDYGITVIDFDRFFKEKNKSGKNKIKISELFSINLRSFGLVILFDKVKFVPFLRLRMKLHSKLILWNWNVRNERDVFLEGLFSNLCDIWTFDANESRKNGWKLNNQFYIPSKFSNNTENDFCLTAFCACVDKNRYDLLRVIKNKLSEKNITCHFIVVKDGSSNYKDEDSNWIVREAIPYSKFLKYTIESNIIVDLVQPGQTGITVRTLEALFYDKKLITNNPDITNYPFYKESNIYLWDKDSSDTKLDLFLEAEYEPISEELKQPYTVEAWIDTFKHDENIGGC